MKIIILLTLVLVNLPLAYATKCGEVIYNKKGMLVKYKYANESLTNGTNKYGTSDWTTGANTEYITSVFDPGVWTGTSTAAQQSLSTYGDCRWFGLVAMAEQRVQYIAQNIEAIKYDLSSGEGHFSEILIGSYFCDKKHEPQFKQMIQSNYIKLNISELKAREIDQELINLIKSNSHLSQSCQLVTKA